MTASIERLGLSSWRLNLVAAGHLPLQPKGQTDVNDFFLHGETLTTAAFIE